MFTVSLTSTWVLIKRVVFSHFYKSEKKKYSENTACIFVAVALKRITTILKLRFQMHYN